MQREEINPYQLGLERNPANHVALSPLSFLRRAARVYPQYPSVIDGARRFTWSDTWTRCCRLASALQQLGVGLGDTVAIMAPNVTAMMEAHFGVPMTGAVLNTLNVRLDAETLAFMLRHGEARVLITDREFSGVIAKALALLEHKPVVIDIDDPEYQGGELLGIMDYEALLATGDPAFAWELPADEWQAISLSYTSGTTGNPKGVVYHHRGAYLNALGNVLAWNMAAHPVYLWTLPMFHCNGWCFPWTIAAVAGTHVCLRRVDAKAIFSAIREHGVTHFSGAPIVLNALINAPEEVKFRVAGRVVECTTGGAAPPATVIQGLESLGMNVTQVYGLTEVYGPTVSCAWNREWDARPAAERAQIKAQQGVCYHIQEDLMVADPETLQPCPADGQTIGEVFMRGNAVMKGYLKNADATAEAFAGGWFHTGDLGVLHPNGYLQIKDRSKDIVISGGENISTIEVEDVLYRHPAVLEAAVVARPDEKWGETPCAFITLRPGVEASEAELVAFCREHLAHFKAPKAVVFGALPKTSTGKVQKYLLRDQAKALKK
ncbi:acyl-CoA synthetase [Janthinobacterium sp. 17J80-10]|uniref:acyl-CoA synthetase n=1 Tax=Janthinobacterium sp. 17J80-10 TaxID=2497863 RepID=UPI0010058323|nr:acyl-CoA synthetase [Janthinobacterium sp. 17J80-10]QAU35056.1 acyl-CoA synthetase [Janthinobacterium sp. 17J80-10]